MLLSSSPQRVLLSTTWQRPLRPTYILLKCSSVRRASSKPTLPESLAIQPSSIYISKSTCPLWNLSFEDLYVSQAIKSIMTHEKRSLGRLFRKMPPGSPLLLIYRDKPCVVIGRNQNPWKEINLGALRAAEIPFVRRRSGGGTVYHVSGILFLYSHK